MNFLESSGVESTPDIQDFRGPVLLGDVVDGPYCLDAQNVEFVDTGVQTRRGFGQAWNPSVAIIAMYNWLQSQYNRVIYLTSAGAVVARDLVTPANTYNLVTGLTAALGLSCVPAGFRIYMAFFKERSSNPGNPQTAYPVRIWDGTLNTGVPNVEIAFSPPMATTAVAINYTEPGAGVVTAGDHNFGFLILTWNGGTPPPSPWSAGSFVPTTVTAAGSTYLNVVVDPTANWPSYVQSVQLIMTTADNPDRYYIVPGSVAVIRDSSTPASFDVNVDDVTLQLYEEIIPGSGNDYFSVFQYDGTLSGPFGAMKLIGYGSRMTYIYEGLGPDLITSASYIAFSNPGMPQFATLAQNVLSLPEFRQCITGFVLGDVIYLLGPGWTYAFSDNGLTPVQWSQPRLVSGAIGSPFVNGVLSNPTRGYAWVADRSGLYFFTGSSYPVRPSSYFQGPDWQRINWLAEVDSMEILDDVENRIVMVKAPLDESDTANYWMVWDYTIGPTPETIRYCGLWFIDSFSPGGLAPVLNPTANSMEIWSARRTAGNVLRFKDWTEDDLYEDDGAGIDDLYTYGYFPKGVQTEVMDHMGADLRIRGNGTALLTANSLDDQNPQPMPSITLSSSPSRRYFRACNKQNEGVSYSISTGAVAGSYFVLTALRAFWRRFAWRT